MYGEKIRGEGSQKTEVRSQKKFLARKRPGVLCTMAAIGHSTPGRTAQGIFSDFRLPTSDFRLLLFFLFALTIFVMKIVMGSSKGLMRILMLVRSYSGCVFAVGVTASLKLL